MQNLTDILGKNVEITFQGIAWNDKLRKVFKTLDEFMDGPTIREMVLDFFRADTATYYDNANNSRKKYKQEIVVSLSFHNHLPNTREMNEIIRLYKDAGCEYRCDWLGGREVVYALEFKNRTDYESSDLEQKVEMKNSSVKFTTPKDCYGNGYNCLSGKVITEYRNRLYDCLEGIKLNIMPVIHGFVRTPAKSRFAINVQPLIVSKSKLSKLEKEFKEDPVIVKATETLSSVSKGIADYYADKQARGDSYTGD